MKSIDAMTEEEFLEFIEVQSNTVIEVQSNTVPDEFRGVRLEWLIPSSWVRRLLAMHKDAKKQLDDIRKQEVVESLIGKVAESFKLPKELLHVETFSQPVCDMAYPSPTLSPEGNYDGFLMQGNVSQWVGHKHVREKVYMHKVDFADLLRKSYCQFEKKHPSQITRWTVEDNHVTCPDCLAVMEVKKYTHGVDCGIWNPKTWCGRDPNVGVGNTGVGVTTVGVGVPSSLKYVTCPDCLASAQAKAFSEQSKKTVHKAAFNLFHPPHHAVCDTCKCINPEITFTEDDAEVTCTKCLAVIQAKGLPKNVQFPGPSLEKQDGTVDEIWNGNPISLPWHESNHNKEEPSPEPAKKINFREFL